VEPFTLHKLEEAFRAAAEAMGIKVGSFFTPFRVAITGKTVSPPLFESMVVLGRAETIRRVQGAQAALKAHAAAAV
jgi:glutamyl-tRNA synthetase